MERERFLARNAADGRVLWDQPWEGRPDDLRLAGTDALAAFGAHLLCYDTRTGRIRWRQRPGGVINALSSDAERVYVATEGPVFAVARDTGRVLWKGPRLAVDSLAPMWEAGLLIAPDVETATLHALRSSTGEAVWGSEDGEGARLGPATGDVLIHYPEDGGSHARRLSDGEILWQMGQDRSFEGGIALTHAAFCLCDGNLYAVNAQTGERLWRRSPADEEDAFFAVDRHDGLLLAHTWRGRLLRLDPDTGKVLAAATVGQVQHLSARAPVVYCAATIRTEEEAQEWRVTAFDTEAGEELWTLKPRRPIADVTVADDVLVLEQSESILALKIA
jgi:outer membrane protein assembly factor BamB